MINNRKKLITQITDQNTRLSKARELLLLNDIEPEDYKVIKKECEAKIIRWEAELGRFGGLNQVDLCHLEQRLVFIALKNSNY